MKKDLRIFVTICIVAALLIGLLFVRPRNLFTVGVKALDTGNYEKAFKQFTSLSIYPNFLNPNRDESEVLIQQSDDLRIIESAISDQDYVKAVLTYQHFLASYPESIVFGKVEDNYLRQPYEWVETLKENGEFQQSFEIFGELYNDETLSNEQKAAVCDEIKDICDQWNYDIRNNGGDYILAIDLYKKMYLVISEKNDFAMDNVMLKYLAELVESHTSNLMDNDFTSAINYYNEYLDWLEENSSSGYKIAASSMTYCKLLIAEAEQSTDPEFQLSKYAEVLEKEHTAKSTQGGNTSSITSYMDSIRELYGETALKLANDYFRHQKYDQAAPLYVDVMLNYADSYGSKISVAAQKSILQNLDSVDIGDMKKMELLQLMDESSPAADYTFQSELYYSMAMVNMDQAKIQSSAYFDAIEHLLLAKELSQDDLLLEKIDNSIVQIRENVAIDDGKAGDLLIKAFKKWISYPNDTKFPICDDDICITEEVYDVLEDVFASDENTVLYISTDYLPDGLRAENPGQAHYYAEIYDPRTTIQVCSYQTTRGFSTAFKVYRKRVDRLVNVFDVETGLLLASKTWPGELPNACPDDIKSSHPSETYEGDEVEIEIVYEWLTDFIENRK